MEMVLELLQQLCLMWLEIRFNPSSNGNGAGIFQQYPQPLSEYPVSILLLMEMVLEFKYDSSYLRMVGRFNPSSNGNGAGIEERNYYC